MLTLLKRQARMMEGTTSAAYVAAKVWITPHEIPASLIVSCDCALAMYVSEGRGEAERDRGQRKREGEKKEKETSTYHKVPER
jgi:hypothetical protein